MTRYILDTREAHEFRDSHVDGALNTPPHEFNDDALPPALAGADINDEIIVYCRSGMRSNTVGRILQTHGFTNVINGTNEHHVRKLLETLDDKS